MPPKAFVSLLQDKKHSHRLDMMMEPNAWDNIVAEVKAIVAKGCRCLSTMKKKHSSSGADSSSCAASSILPEGPLEDFVMWSREGPMPIKANRSGTIADLKQAIVMQLWISPRLDIKLESVSGEEGVLDAVQDPSQITFATLSDSDAISSYAHSAFSDKHLVRRAVHHPAPAPARLPRSSSSSPSNTLAARSTRVPAAAAIPSARVLSAVRFPAAGAGGAGQGERDGAAGADSGAELRHEDAARRRCATRRVPRDGRGFRRGLGARSIRCGSGRCHAWVSHVHQRLHSMRCGPHPHPWVVDLTRTHRAHAHADDCSRSRSPRLAVTASTTIRDIKAALLKDSARHFAHVPEVRARHLYSTQLARGHS